MDRQLTTRLALAAAALLLIAAPSVLTAQERDTDEGALKAAMDLEVLEGDLNGAIERYERLADSGNRSVAARALVRLGQSYETLGQDEARATYERVVREFADQVEAVATARARLAALPPLGDGDAGAVPQLVWEGAPLDGGFFLAEAAISPDGRYLVFVTPAGLDVLDLVTGVKQPLLTDSQETGSGESAGRGQRPFTEPPQASPLRLEIVSTLGRGTPYFSPDGTAVVLSVVDDRDIDRETSTIGLVSFPSGDSQMLKLDEGWRGRVRGWSSDGTQILIDGRHRGGPMQAALVSVADGSVRSVNGYPQGFTLPMSLSPDARYLAYVEPPKGDTVGELVGGIGIVILGISDGAMRHLDSAAGDKAPIFAPDGLGLLFLRRGPGEQSYGAWYQRLVEGKPRGAPVLLKAGLGADPRLLGFGSNDSLYYYTYPVNEPPTNISIWVLKDFLPASRVPSGSPSSR